MQIYGWELYAACHDLEKFCEHKYCDSGDIILSCHVTSSKHMVQELCQFMGGSQSEPSPSHVLWPLGI